MIYTVRFAHMKDAPKWKLDDIIKPNDIIGTMGTSGQSTAAHVHIDCVKGLQERRYTIMDILHDNPISDKRQLDFFIDYDLFKVKPFITTGYEDQEYFETFHKWHRGYDVVPIDRHKTQEHYDIHWNRSMNGKVCLVVDEPEAYGHCIYISFVAF